MSTDNRLVLIDTSGFIFRAYHKLPPLTRRDGTPIGAVYGYINLILKLIGDLHATHIAAVFDADRQNFRHEIYPQYKAHRPPLPEDLIPQFPLVRLATEAMSLPVIECPGFEADDVIATYARLGREAGWDVLIVSSDKDLMQLIDNRVKMYDSMQDKQVGADEVVAKFGVKPESMIDLQALVGDSTDNVPGVPGIGPKTAAELLAQFGTLEGLIERHGEIKQPKRRELIAQYAEQARISKRLVTLDAYCEGLPMIEELEAKVLDQVRLMAFLEEQNFTSLLNRLQKKFGIEPTAAPMMTAPGADPLPVPITQIETRYELVKDEATLAEWVKRAREKGLVAFDVETTSLDAMRAELVGFSLCLEIGHACYVPLAHKNEGGGNDLFSNPISLCEGQITLERAIELIRPLLEDDSVMKIGHNMKYDMLVMHRHGIRIAPIEDTMLLSYCLSAGLMNQNMDELSEKLLGIRPVSFDEVTGKGKARVTFDKVELDTACRYAAEDADITLRLYEVLKPRLLAEHLVSVYERMERPLVPVVEEMEHYGIKVDVNVLRGLSGMFGRDIGVLEEEIYKLAGRPFTIGSPKQLGEILFDEQNVGGGKKSAKSGAYATGAQILEELAEQGHVLPAKVLEWRQLTKLKTTYTDALIGQIDPNTGRVHTSFSLAVTSTGRLSSSDPNLQNIPIRTEQGKRIRDAFVADAGYKLLSADYSQIELRILAHVAELSTFKDAFREGRDIHATTASQMFGMPVDQVSGELRRRAKMINFGIIYGISAHGLASRLGIGREEAGSYIKLYFEQYPGIREYMEKAKEEARDKGYVTTLWGRRCYVKGIRDKNPNMRAFSERAAINAPIQGSAADIIKKAMVTLDRTIREEKWQSRMLLQVHDELLFEVAEGEAEAIPARVKTLMENAAHLSVPLQVETGLGLHWGEIH